LLLPKNCNENILKAERLTENETGTVVIIAIGYGGQAEIIRAIGAYLRHEDTEQAVTIERFKRHIETDIYPPPDLIIRTG
jgi:short-chain Z-isoprenyl diphosphate synthase